MTRPSRHPPSLPLETQGTALPTAMAKANEGAKVSDACRLSPLSFGGQARCRYRCALLPSPASLRPALFEDSDAPAERRRIADGSDRGREAERQRRRRPSAAVSACPLPMTPACL